MLPGWTKSLRRSQNPFLLYGGPVSSCCHRRRALARMQEIRRHHRGWGLKYLKIFKIFQEAIVRTIRCAQHEMFGRKAADICSKWIFKNKINNENSEISCCELFMNISPPTHTDCSRHCVFLMRRPDMNVERMVNSLDYCKEGAEMQFQVGKLWKIKISKIQGFWELCLAQPPTPTPR